MIFNMIANQDNGTHFQFSMKLNVQKIQYRGDFSSRRSREIVMDETTLSRLSKCMIGLVELHTLS